MSTYREEAIVARRRVNVTGSEIDASVAALDKETISLPRENNTNKGAAEDTTPNGASPQPVRHRVPGTPYWVDASTGVMYLDEKILKNLLTN